MADSSGTIETPGMGTIGTTGSGREKSNGSSHDSISSLNRRAHAAVDKAAEVATQTADWLSSSHKTLTESTCTYVQANPLRSIGMAFAAGFVLAKLMR